MATQQNSNELRVEQNANIEEDLRPFSDMALACASFYKEEERTLPTAGTTATGSSDTSTGASNAKVEFVDGRPTTIQTLLYPISGTMEIAAGEYDDKKRAEIEARADKSKTAKEREGIGE